MCRRESRGTRSIATDFFSQYVESVLRRKGLVLIGMMSLGFGSGCVSSGQRSLSFRLPRSHSVVAQVPDRQAAKPVAPIAEAAREEAASAIQLARDESSPSPGEVIPSEDGANEGSSPSSAQAAIPPGPTVMELPAAGISLADLQMLAVENNPTLSQAQAAITAEQGIYRQSGLYPNPQLGYLNGAASNPSVKNSNGMFVSQEFVTAHKLDLAQKSSLVEIQRYQWDLESQRLRILNDLKIRYYEVLGAQQAMAVAERLVGIAEKGVAMAEHSLQAKQSTRTDLLQAQVQLETVRLSREEAEHRYAAAWEQLATIIGICPMSPVPLLGDLTSDIPNLDHEIAWQTLLANSPQIRSTECDLGHAWATYREARAQAVPNVTVQAVGEFDRATNATTVSTLVAMPFPVFNRNQGNIDKSSADIVAAQSEISRVQLVLRDQLADSFRRYKTSRRQAERLQKVIELTNENMQLTEQVYAARETSLSVVLAAQQAGFHNQLAYVEALTELHKVATEIQGLQLTGGLNPAAIGSAIQNAPGGGAQRQRALLNEVQDRASKQLLPAAQISQ